MSFLAPLFLGGLLAIAAPIIFHLIRRTSRERIPFSSLMFLQPTPPRVTRSSRLEHILLLILRCVALCLLALGFARPFLQRPMTADTGSKENRRLAIVIDASASMRRDGLWSEAKSKAERAIRRVRPTDTLAVFLLDRTARPLLTFDQWTATP
ncbi:MAG TPA: VWA domain-containing protein, partial [Candidatus Saccharimonadales bacterium]|nr:VWA domain-containing protein [Candidatus Saccharimonadales bacterium]